VSAAVRAPERELESEATWTVSGRMRAVHPPKG
jgi:hypothetical protein